MAFTGDALVNHSCWSLWITVKAMEKSCQVDVLIMDFSKAFNKICHKLLIHKLHHYGISGKINLWIMMHFLADRRQSVLVGGSRSEFEPVESGVPQGSVLGPTLFQLYLPEGLMPRTCLFANDTICHWDVTCKVFHILHDDGKLTKILQAMCPLIQNVKQCGGELANIIMQRVKNPFWVAVFRHTHKKKTCQANVHPWPLMILYWNVYITMLIYAEEKGLYVPEIGQTVVIFCWYNLLVPINIFLTMNLKQNFPMLRPTFCCMN